MKVLFVLLMVLIFPIHLTEAATFNIDYVVDGDTLKLSDGQIVNLIGIDAPESQPNEKAKSLARRRNIDIGDITLTGKKARVFAQTLLQNKEVRLEYDIEQRDREGNLQAYVYLQVCSWRDTEPNCKSDAIPGHIYVVLKNGPYEYGKYIFVNATLILSGYATPLALPPNIKYSDEFKNLFEIAKKNKMGLWR